MIIFLYIRISSKSYFFSTSNSFSNYFNKLINILSMFSFLFHTFINLYLGLVVSYIRDLNPQYNFSITASWWGSMLAKSFKFKSVQGFIHKPSGINNSEISCQCFLKALWSVVSSAFQPWKVGKWLRETLWGFCGYLGWGLGLVNFSMGVLETSQQKILD